MVSALGPTPVPTTDKPPRLRRWIPRSLRFFIFILAMTATWTGVRAYRQMDTIWGIQRVGGRVIKIRPQGPPWLYEHVMAIWPYFEVVGVDFGNSKATDATMVHMTKLKSLEYIFLNNTPLTDSGLARLSALTKLEQVKLEGTQVTDEGVAELERALPGLKISR
jgi:hypothetical protein